MASEVGRLVKLGVLSALFLAAVSMSEVSAENPQTIETRVGKLHFKNNYPTAETAAKLKDELLFQAAVQLYLWSLPIMDVVAVRDCHHAAGVSNTGVPIFESYLSPKTVVPTGNQETIYAYGVVTLGDEPMVVEAVPGVLGFIADAWQRPIDDVGLTGPDEGKGGKFLVVPPGYKGDLKEDGYFVLRSPTKKTFGGSYEGL
jgi:hypothetical protein